MRRNKCGVSPRAQKTCRVLALWALQMKHTRFSRKKNASTAAAAILGLPATKGLGFIGDGWRIRTWFSMRKPYAIAERGFSLNKQMREKGIQAQWNIATSFVQLTAKAGKGGGCDLMAHWALLRRYDRGVSTVQLCTLIWCIWHVDPVAGCPTYQRKEVERQE